MENYNVVCRGEILPGCDPETARKELAGLFKVAPPTMDRLLSGQSVTVKKDTDCQTAEKYRQAAKRCGILFHVLPTSGKPPDGGNSTPVGTTKSAPASKSITCPHCGLEQGLSNTCIQCGGFVLKTSEKEPAGQASLEPNLKKKPSDSLPPLPPKGLFRKFRIAILTGALVIIGLSAWLNHLHVTSWKVPLTVGIYPINADGSQRSATYIDTLDETAFEPIEAYFVQEAQDYGLRLEHPFEFVVADEISELPPAPPSQKNLFKVIWWSLKLRHWAHIFSWQHGLSQDIKLFVLYYDTDGNVLLDHSLGLKESRIGIVHAYAADSLVGKNSVVMAHEILHTVGATDKYDLTSHQPIYPGGFADPDLDPPYPQKYAEIMGSRIPKTPISAIMPPDLDSTVIGYVTAEEIRWVH
jgi:hypothetical protein